MKKSNKNIFVSRLIIASVFCCIANFLNGCISEKYFSEFTPPEKDCSIRTTQLEKFRIIKVKSKISLIGDEFYDDAFFTDSIMETAIEYYPNIFSNSLEAVPIEIKQVISTDRTYLGSILTGCTLGIIPFPSSFTHSNSMQIYINNENINNISYDLIQTTWMTILSPLGLIPIPGRSSARSSGVINVNGTFGEYSNKLFLGALVKSLKDIAPVSLQLACNKYRTSKISAQYAENNHPIFKQAIVSSYKLPSINIADLSYHALIIANNNYRYLPKLKSPHNDAKTLAAVLQSQYNFEIQILKDATRDDIIKALRQYEKNLSDKDCFMIYYAGHGWLDKKTDTGFWLPVDASIKNESNWLENAYISRVAKASNARHILVISDSCYAGKLTRGLSVVGNNSIYHEKLITRRSRTVMTSGGNEPVLDSGGREKHSVFASALIDALENNDKLVDCTSLFSIIRRKVMLEAEQQPEYSDIRKAGHDGGDFIFVRKKQNRREK